MRHLKIDVEVRTKEKTKVNITCSVPLMGWGPNFSQMEDAGIDETI